MAYHPLQNHLIQIEPSIDAYKWQKREQRFKKKFDSGRKYIISEIFPWLPHNKKFEQWAILSGSDKNHPEVGGGKVIPIWKLYRMIAKDVIAVGSPTGNAIPESLPLLRTMQYTLQWGAQERDESDNEEGEDAGDSQKSRKKDH